MKLIDSDKSHLKLLDMEFPIYDQDPILDVMDDCTVDAAQVVHGRWMDVGSLSCRCSNCGCKNRRETDYCPNCKAKMDLPYGE